MELANSVLLAPSTKTERVQHVTSHARPVLVTQHQTVLHARPVHSFRLHQATRQTHVKVHRACPPVRMGIMEMILQIFVHHAHAW